MMLDIFRTVLKRYPQHPTLAFNTVAVLYGYRNAMLIQSIDYITDTDLDNETYTNIKTFVQILVYCFNQTSKDHKVGFYEYDLTTNPHLLIFSKNVTDKKFKTSISNILSSKRPSDLDIGYVLGYMNPGCSGLDHNYSVSYYITDTKSTPVKQYNIFSEVVSKKPSKTKTELRAKLLFTLAKKLGYSLTIKHEEHASTDKLINACNYDEWSSFKIVRQDILNSLTNAGFYMSAKVVYDCDIYKYKKYQYYWRTLIIENKSIFERINTYLPLSPKVDKFYQNSMKDFEKKIYDLYEVSPVSKRIIKKEIYKTMDLIEEKLVELYH